MAVAAAPAVAAGVTVATLRDVTYTYPAAPRPALDGVTLDVRAGELTLVLGPSASGKSTLLRALAGLVPHFHGGRFAGRVTVAGRDTRSTRPAELAGAVACLFQDPESQVVMGRVLAEVAFGLENTGCPPADIVPRAVAALASVGSEHLQGRRTDELSGGELQRVCLASTLALEPCLLLLDEPTSQLDAEAADHLLDLALAAAGERRIAVVCSEQRVGRLLPRAGRVLFVDEGRIRLDAPLDEALAWLAANEPDYLPGAALGTPPRRTPGELLCRVDCATFAYVPGGMAAFAAAVRSPAGGGGEVLRGASLELRRGEVVALVGANGSGKTTLAKLAAGLLEPSGGSVERHGRAAYLSQDPGRYLARDRVEDEVALGVGGDRERARAALAWVGLAGQAHRHPRDLSSGERERLAVASVLVTQPDILVLDEPTRGVDPVRKRELAALIAGRAADGAGGAGAAGAPAGAPGAARATLLVTHDLELVAGVADRVLRVAEGRVVAQA